MKLELVEWQRVDDLALSGEQVAALVHTKAVEVRPSGTGTWQVRAQSLVGVLHAPGLEIRIRPKVPVGRLLELLCESIGRIAWDPVDTDWVETNDLWATIAGSFCSQVERVLHQGLLQGYQEREEAIFGVKGRLQIGAQLSRRAGVMLPVEVIYDDYTVDVIENRLLAGATRLLMRLPGIPAALRSRLRRVEQTMAEVTPMPASRTPPSIEWTRLNNRYRPAATLAQIILRSCAVDDGTGRDVVGSGFLVNMNQVFEDVVGNGLANAAARSGGASVRLQATDHLDLDQLIEIRPDVICERNGRCVAVADVKYKLPATDNLANADVYQVLAYAHRFGLGDVHLIYGETPTAKRFHLEGLTVHLHSVDLSGSKAQRDARLHELGISIFDSAQSMIGA